MGNVINLDFKMMDTRVLPRVRRTSLDWMMHIYTAYTTYTQGAKGDCRPAYMDSSWEKRRNKSHLPFRRKFDFPRSWFKMNEI
jgi:hypothetical protein